MLTVVCKSVQILRNLPWKWRALSILKNTRWHIPCSFKKTFLVSLLLCACPIVFSAVNEQEGTDPDSPLSEDDHEPLFRLVQIDDEESAESVASHIKERLILDASSDANPQAITQHNMNYFLFMGYNNELNNFPLSAYGQQEEDGFNDLQPFEAKFQFSIKALLGAFENGSRLYFGFTSLSFWQVYNSKQSSPFRETNYEPEIFWTIPFHFRFLSREINVATLGFSHQSNGQSLPGSRSWNRLYAILEWEAGDFVVQFKPWYRIPEQRKDDPTVSSGDDNPDIDKYMGHFELSGQLRNHRNSLGFMVRNNLRSDNKGAFQLDWTFPVRYQLKPYIQYFVGYGESLIDYNALTRRVSVGILLGEWL